MKQNYPKIGIRPTIDGRQGGIREGLEEKTMNLAKERALKMPPFEGGFTFKCHTSPILGLRWLSDVFASILQI